MAKDGFAWWKRRFEQMSNYFDAFRIDHILGFFRIWSIPMRAVQGILGHFEPAIPVYRSEFQDRGIPFDHDRYTRPFINDAVLWELFGANSDRVKTEYLRENGNGFFVLREAYDTQRKVEDHFRESGRTAGSDMLKPGLLDLVSNVILLEGGGFRRTAVPHFPYRDGEHLFFPLPRLGNPATFKRALYQLFL